MFGLKNFFSLHEKGMVCLVKKGFEFTQGSVILVSIVYVFVCTG